MMNQFEDAIYLQDHITACPYLHDRVATLRMANGFLAASQYRELLDLGYRRSGMLVYRPDCQTCNECQIIRVPVETFKRSKEQRRVWKRGQEIFRTQLQPPSFTQEKFALYHKYLRGQHGTFKPQESPEDYEHFLVQSCLGGGTFEMQVLVEDKIGRAHV